MTEQFTPEDSKWLQALKPYWGGGVIPYFRKLDGTIDAERTMENFAKAHNFRKIGPNGEELEWPK